MATFTFFHEAIKNIGNGTIDFDSHTFKAMLTNTAPSQSNNTVKADITEISAGSGYTAGGATLSSVTWAETGAGTGVFRFDCDNIAWTASGGAIAAHRYLVVYDDTAAGDELVGYVDRGSSDTIADGNTRTWTVSASGLFETSLA